MYGTGTLSASIYFYNTLAHVPVDLHVERFHETADKMLVNSKALEKLFV